MAMYRLISRQRLPISQVTAWKFLSDPANLKVITPEHMGFDILCGADRTMYPGQIIQYRVKPFPWISTRWVTEITHVKEGAYFVDEQRFGPYALWHHKHFLYPTDSEGSVDMEDIIDYKVPFGIVGQLVHTLVIKKQLNKIFKYREEKLRTLFGESPNSPTTLVFKSI